MTADPEVVGVTVPMVIAAASAVCSAIGGVALFFMRHSFETEKKLMVLGIETAKEQADTAMKKVAELNDKIHDIEKTAISQGGAMKALESDVRRLDTKDDAQALEIRDVVRRLDRGARTFSAQMPASSEDPDELPPMRRRLPSRGGA